MDTVHPTFDAADEELAGYSSDSLLDPLAGEDGRSRAEDHGVLGTEDDQHAPGDEISTDVYADLMRSVPLLSRREEERLGKTVFDSRVAMSRALSRVPAASALLAARFLEVERGERPRTDVFFAPFQKVPDVSNDDTSPVDGATDAAGVNDGGKSSTAVRAVWRDAGAALVARLEEWRSSRGEQQAQRAAKRLAGAFRALGPGFVVLREALEKCQALDERVGAVETRHQLFHADLLASDETSDDEALVKARRQLLDLETEAGIELTTLRACCRAAAKAHGEYRRARARMVSANLKLAHHLAYRVAGNGVAVEDLVQEAMIGLMRAVDRFDYRLGYKFSTYAFHWIRQTTMLAIAEASRTVRVAPHMHDRIRRLRKVAGELEQRFGRIPTPAELIEASGLTPAQVELAQDASRVPASLDAPLSNVEDSNLHALIEDPARTDPSDAVAGAERAEQVAKLLDTLPPREAFILRLRYGIGVRAPHTLEDIGARLGITRERTRQLESLAMAKLRERLALDASGGERAVPARKRDSQ